MQTLQKRSQHWSIFLNMLAIARVEGFDLWLRASPACSTDLEKIKMVVSPVLSDTLDHSGKKALVQCFQLVGYIPLSFDQLGAQQLCYQLRWVFKTDASLSTQKLHGFGGLISRWAIGDIGIGWDPFHPTKRR